MKYRYVGNTPEELDGGQPLAPGDFTGDIEVGEDTPKAQQLLDDGKLIEVPTKDEKEEAKEKEKEEKEKAEAEAEAEKEKAAAKDKAKEGRS